MVTAILPAHNEQGTLPAAIASLRAQSVPVDRILVVSDNSTDLTVEVAKTLGVDVMETVGNTDRKAGALNQGIAAVDDEYLLVMDADTEIVPEFVEHALANMMDDVGGVGAVFGGKEQSLLELCQTNEWQRYKREVGRTGRVWVLSGTAALLRREALVQVQQARREGKLPGNGYYCAEAATEDMELTLALRTCGWNLRSPLECESKTELMPTLRDLWNQRLRWYGGALDCLRDYGFTRISWRYFVQQFMLGLSSLSMSLLITVSLLLGYFGAFGISPFWMAIGAIFWTERVLTVRGRKAKLWSALLFPELAYAIFLQFCWVWSLIRSIFRRKILWTHLDNPRQQLEHT